MAQLIRKKHHLPAIRIGFVPSGNGGCVTFECFDGSKLVARAQCLASSIGIQPKLNVRAYRGVIFQLPDDVLLALRDQLRAIKTVGPVWLQVEPSSGHLAVVPWERLLCRVTAAPLLRIPNLTSDPVIPRGPIRMVLCVSSSPDKIKRPSEVIKYVHEFVALTTQGLSSGSELHLFTNSVLYDDVKELAQAGPISVRVHNPFDIGSDETDRLLKNSATSVESPWLRWIERSLAGEAVAAVHFVCPGYFSLDEGALALAHSPMDTSDDDISHLVEAEELITFLNQLGAWYVGFSPPPEDIWAIGLRLLADRLVWRRPGTLLLHDRDFRPFDYLLKAFSSLFKGSEERFPKSSHLMLYCPPSRLSQFQFNAPKFDSVRDRSMGHRELSSPALEKLALNLSTLALANEKQAEQPGWKQSGMRLMDQIALQSTGMGNSAQRGALEALKKVSPLFNSEEQQRLEALNRFSSLSNSEAQEALEALNKLSSSLKGSDQ